MKGAEPNRIRSNSLDRFRLSNTRVSEKWISNKKRNNKNNSTVSRHALAKSTHCAHVSRTNLQWNAKIDFASQHQYSRSIYLFCFFYLSGVFHNKSRRCSKAFAIRSPIEKNETKIAWYVPCFFDPFPIQSPSTLNAVDEKLFTIGNYTIIAAVNDERTRIYTAVALSCEWYGAIVNARAFVFAPLFRRHNVCKWKNHHSIHH